MNRDFWRGRRVFITGHTGFKGSWLTQWLKVAGSTVSGYSLGLPTEPSLFEVAGVGKGIASTTGDVRDLGALRAAIASSQPEIVIHLAAQSLVRLSYDDPVGTYGTNVMGTVNLLEALRAIDSIRVVIIVTSDKCYEHGPEPLPFREDDAMGGGDPYSSSKGCAELVTAAYRQSYFGRQGAPRIVSVRAGNVIGGGDWAKDRLVPDLVRAFCQGRPATIRNPDATRPWQFVLDPLHGYLLLTEALFERDGLPHAWNFGPDAQDTRPVRWMADAMTASWGNGATWHREGGDHRPEAFSLMLDSSRARNVLGWKPVVDASAAIDWTAHWYRTWLRDAHCAETTTNEQIERFAAAAAKP